MWFLPLWHSPCDFFHVVSLQSVPRFVPWNFHPSSRQKNASSQLYIVYSSFCVSCIQKRKEILKSTSKVWHFNQECLTSLWPFADLLTYWHFHRRCDLLLIYWLVTFCCCQFLLLLFLYILISLHYFSYFENFRMISVPFILYLFATSSLLLSTDVLPH